MKKSALTILALLAMTSVTFGVSISLDFIDNPDGDTTLDRYILRATGTGIVAMTSFEINCEVNQVWNVVMVDDDGVSITPDVAVVMPSEWTFDHSADEENKRDSFVMFGIDRIPDMPYYDPVDEVWKSYSGKDKFTLETNPAYDPENPPTAAGTLESIHGTLANGTPLIADPELYTDYEDYDSYSYRGLPTAEDDTYDLMQLVVASGTDVSLNVTLTTLTGYTIGQDDDGLPVAIGGKTTAEIYTWPADDWEVGDTDKDGDIDGIDLGNFASGWFGPDGSGNNGTSSATASWETGDFDGNGVVDGIDLGDFATGWFGPNGDGYVAPASAVPEPSTIVMLILGALCMVGYRARK